MGFHLYPKHCEQCAEMDIHTVSAESPSKIGPLILVVGGPDYLYVKYETPAVKIASCQNSKRDILSGRLLKESGFLDKDISCI